MGEGMAPYICTPEDALEFLRMHVVRGELCCEDCGRRAREKAESVAQIIDDYACATRDLGNMEATITTLRAEITTALAEGARRERERIRARSLTNALGAALHRAAAGAVTENAPPGINPAPDWSALLAAITSVNEANTEGE